MRNVDRTKNTITMYYTILVLLLFKRGRGLTIILSHSTKFVYGSEWREISGISKIFKKEWFPLSEFKKHFNLYTFFN